MNLALVTGATGMLGTYMVERLLTAGVRVRAFLRSESEGGKLAALPVEVVRGAPDHPDALCGAVRDCQWVFHLAAYLHVGSAFDDQEHFDAYKRANVDFTQALLAASREAGVARFVYASSVAVYAPQERPPIAEDAPLEPASGYGRSKLLAEGHVRAYQRDGLDTTVIRPCITYGQGDRHFLPAALGLARLPVLPLVDGGRHLLDLVYAGDVAELMWRASQAEIATGRAYNAASGAPQSLCSLFRDYGRCGGHVPWIWSVSPGAFRRLSPALQLILKRMVPGVQSLLSPLGIAYMGQDVCYSMSAARRDLGYTPQMPFRQGLELSLKRGP